MVELKTWALQLPPSLCLLQKAPSPDDLPEKTPRKWLLVEHRAITRTRYQAWVATATQWNAQFQMVLLKIRRLSVGASIQVAAPPKRVRGKNQPLAIRCPRETCAVHFAQAAVVNPTSGTAASLAPQQGRDQQVRREESDKFSQEK